MTETSTLGGSHQIIVPIIRYSEFLRDTERIGRGVVVLSSGWEQALENNKQAYASEFVQTSRFITAFPTRMTPTQFVDKLNQNAGNVLSASERTTAINLFGGAADSSNATARAQALRQVADDRDLFGAEFNRAFVLTEFFGYLRRNPNDPPELNLDYTGYEFWLTKLNQFNGDYLGAEMVKAFIQRVNIGNGLGHKARIPYGANFIFDAFLDMFTQPENFPDARPSSINSYELSILVISRHAPGESNC